MRTKPCLTSADVQKLAAACKAEAVRNGWEVSIAIVDDGGIPFYLERMDGAAATTPDVALSKARLEELKKCSLHPYRQLLQWKQLMNVWENSFLL